MITLVPLSKEEYAKFVERTIAERALEQFQAGMLSREDALKRSREKYQDLITGAAREQGHRFYKAVDSSGHLVGWIWIGPPAALKVDSAQYLYDITIKENVRGRGYGRATLQALEELVALEGIAALHLNVFRSNPVARSLYDSAGYEVFSEGETWTEMRKRLRTDQL